MEGGTIQSTSIPKTYLIWSPPTSNIKLITSPLFLPFTSQRSPLHQSRSVNNRNQTMRFLHHNTTSSLPVLMNNPYNNHCTQWQLTRRVLIRACPTVILPRCPMSPRPPSKSPRHHLGHPSTIIVNHTDFSSDDTNTEHDLDNEIVVKP